MRSRSSRSTSRSNGSRSSRWARPAEETRVPGQLAPGVYFEPGDTAPDPVAALRTDVAGFVGVAERGPLDTPVRVTSWEQFTSAFGGLLADAHLAWAVKGFFENDGIACWVVRVAAGTASTL